MSQFAAYIQASESLKFVMYVIAGVLGENGGAPPFAEHRPPKYNEK